MTVNFRRRAVFKQQAGMARNIVAHPGSQPWWRCHVAEVDVVVV
jgi:hypothetical protein